MKSKILPVLYFLIGILFIVFHYLQINNLMLLTKALIIPTLVLYFVRSQGYSITSFTKLILAALFFSWAGDVFLQLVYLNEFFFMLGLVSFLIAHIFYIIAFIDPRQKKTLIRRKPVLAIPFLVYGISLMWYLYPDLEEMAFPVLIYATVILFMTIIALNRYNNVNRKSFQLVFIGAILFTLSDSLIAIDKFSNPFEASRFLIMSLYITAQFLIVQGCLKQEA